jgi:hypothetical protein
VVRRVNAACEIRLRAEREFPEVAVSSRTPAQTRSAVCIPASDTAEVPASLSAPVRVRGSSCRSSYPPSGLGRRRDRLGSTRSRSPEPMLQPGLPKRVEKPARELFVVSTNLMYR